MRVPQSTTEMGRLGGQSWESAIPIVLVAVLSAALGTALLDDQVMRVTLLACGWLAVTALVMQRLCDRADQLSMWIAVAAYLALQLTATTLFYTFKIGEMALVTPDEIHYVENAEYVIDLWQRHGTLSLSEISNAIGTRNYGFYIWCAGHMFFCSEKSFLLCSNVFIHILTALLLYYAVRRTCEPKHARLAAYLFLFDPQSAYYTMFILKDTSLAFAVALFFAGATTISRSAKPQTFLVIGVALLLCATLRFYLAFMLLGCLGISHGISLRTPNTLRVGIGLSLVAFTALLYFSPLRGTFEEMQQEGVTGAVLNYSERSYDFAADQGWSTTHIVGYDPKSIAIAVSHFLLSPSPFNPNAIDFLLPLLFWYVIFVFSSVGIVDIVSKLYRAPPRDLLIVSMIAAVLAVAVLMPAINEPRHRVAILPLWTVLAAQGIRGRTAWKSRTIAAVVLYIVFVVGVREFLFS